MVFLLDFWCPYDIVNFCFIQIYVDFNPRDFQKEKNENMWCLEKYVLKFIIRVLHEFVNYDQLFK